MFKQIHQDVEKKSKEFYDVLRRYNYVTPTSYLELLSSFDTLLAYKRGEVATKKNRLKIGLDKIISTGELVEGMQKELEILAPQLVVKGKEVDEMMVGRGVPRCWGPSRHLHESSPGEEVVGGLFFDFEAVRTEFGPSRVATMLTPSFRTGRHRQGQERCGRREGEGVSPGGLCH